MTAPVERRCRSCRATTGLRLIPTVLGPREWECANGCPAEAPAPVRVEVADVVATMTAAAPTQETPEFTRTWERLCYSQACTSLSDEDATARMHLAPSGTSSGWTLTTDPELAPVPCADRPDTHRHLLFEC